MSDIAREVAAQAKAIPGVDAAAREAGAAPRFRSLVAIQPKGSRPPLFCIHGGGGRVVWYEPLARRLGEDQPVYGLERRLEDDGRVHTKRVEDMARLYLEEVRAAFPRGPYYLAGVSFGGKVAYEMARMLRAQGETAALVAMFDTWGPGYPRLREGVSRVELAAERVWQRLEHHLGALWMLERGERIPYVRDKLRFGYMEMFGHVEGAAMALARWSFRMRGRGGSIPADLLPTPGFIREANDAYEPRPYDGDVVIFRSKKPPPGAVFDDALGWDRVVRGKITVVELPGIHATMISEPRVRFLVEALRPILEEAQSRHG